MKYCQQPSATSRKLGAVVTIRFHQQSNSTPLPYRIVIFHISEVALWMNVTDLWSDLYQLTDIVDGLLCLTYLKLPQSWKSVQKDVWRTQQQQRITLVQVPSRRVDVDGNLRRAVEGRESAAIHVKARVIRAVMLWVASWRSTGRYDNRPS